MQAVLWVFSKPPEILPARGLRLDNKKTKCKCIHEKSDSKEWKPNLEFRKVRCGANHSKNWAKPPPKHASCTLSQ